MRKLILAKLDPISKQIYNMPYNERGEYQRILRNKVSSIKANYRSYYVSDKLAIKLGHFGNDGAWSRFKLNEFNQKLFRDKKPPSDNIYCAVEIECIFSNEVSYNNFIKDVKDNKLRDSVTIKNDGSLRTNEDCDCDNFDDCSICGDHVEAIPKEIVVFFPKNDMSILKIVCDSLSNKAYVNKSCGLHVHFDFRNSTYTKAVKSAKKLAHIVPLLKLMLPEGRRNNYYCSKVISENGDRYAFVNTTAYRRHQTIEVRGHSGTTSYEKISQWIKLCDAAMNHKKLPDNSTFGEMLCSLDVSNDTYDYAMRRLKKFSPHYMDQFKSLTPLANEIFNMMEVLNNNNSQAIGA